MRVYSLYDAIRDDHHRILSLLNQILGSGKDLKKKLEQYRDLRRELTVHCLFEEEMVYPKVKGQPLFEFFYPLAATHHKTVDTYINRLDKMVVGSADWFRTLSRLREDSLTHMMVKERELLGILKTYPMKIRSRAG